MQLAVSTQHSALSTQPINNILSPSHSADFMVGVCLGVIRLKRVPAQRAPTANYQYQHTTLAIANCQLLFAN